jgi:hypothetical protein
VSYKSARTDNIANFRTRLDENNGPLRTELRENGLRLFENSPKIGQKHRLQAGEFDGDACLSCDENGFCWFLGPGACAEYLSHLAMFSIHSLMRLLSMHSLMISYAVSICRPIEKPVDKLLGARRLCWPFGARSG